MAKQPVLSEGLPSIGEVKMSAYYSEGFFNKESDIPDGMHIHSCFEMYVNILGDVSFLHDREIYDIEPFDIVLSYPADVHYCIYHSSCVHKLFCVWFSDEIIGGFLKRRGIRGRIRPLCKDRERILHILHSLCVDDIDPFIKTARLMELLTLLDAENGKAPKNNAPDKMRAILNFVDEHLTEHCGIGDVAKAFYIAESSLYRMFHTQLGISFQKYVESQRLALAERLLRADHSVTDACYLSGFADCSRFIAKFKKKFGLTPLKYKKMINKED